ncbi:MAG: LysM peptidoglycan-binding domain-containing protein [Clostridium sp.]|nr:MAG: LysM peptidoglycan-binding domain-containing protein [Clostridium sp.]
MKINHLSSSMIYPNQVLFIPSTCNINNDTYLTKECESINDIFE